MSNKTYIGTTEASTMLGISAARVRLLLKQGRIQGAKKQGRAWTIPLFKGMPVVEDCGKGPRGTWYRRRRQAQTIIVVNRTTIGENASKNKNKPPIVVKQGKQSYKCHELEIKGSCRIVYTPHETGPCGSRLWIEVDAEVQLIKKMFPKY